MLPIGVRFAQYSIGGEAMMAYSVEFNLIWMSQNRDWDIHGPRM